MAEVWGVITAAISAGAAAYSANQQKKASDKASAALGQQRTLNLSTIPRPQVVDPTEIQSGTIDSNWNNLGHLMQLAAGVNSFNSRQAIRGYSMIQPNFVENQSLIGRNAASFARGELPTDVVNSIGRAAAQRGIEGGFGMGINAGGANSALGGLNLRNLGLTSLDLSKFGTGVAMDANRNAAAMAPGLFDPSSMFLTPQGNINTALANAHILNDWNTANTNIRNAEQGANVQFSNDIMNQQSQMAYQQSLQQAQAVQGASNTLAGLFGQIGANSGGSYGSSYAATQAAAPNNQISYSNPNAGGVGYAAVPKII